MWNRISGKKSKAADEQDSNVSTSRRAESTTSTNAKKKSSRSRTEDRDTEIEPPPTSYSSVNQGSRSNKVRESVASSDATAYGNGYERSYDAPDAKEKLSRTERMAPSDLSRGDRDRDEVAGSTSSRSKRGKKDRKDSLRDEERSRSYDQRSRGMEATRGPEDFSEQVHSASFQQFPGQYDGGVFGTQPVRPPIPSMISPHVPDQFPGQFPSQSSQPYRPPLAASEGGPGLAADYYGDAGQSVADQPGHRTSSPSLIIGAEPHLQAASAVAAPPPEPSTLGGVGAAASFYSESFEAEEGTSGATHHASSAYISAPEQGQASGSHLPALGGAAAVGAAAAGYMIGAQSSQHEHTEFTSSHDGQNTYISSTTQRPPPSQSNASFYTSNERPSHHSNPPSSSSNIPLYAAGAAGAAGLAAAAIHHNHRPSASQPGSGQHTSTPMAHRRRQQDGPLSAFVDFFRDPEAVAQYEEYTEFIGVCRNCFDPGSTPRDAPRKHHYRRKRSDERLGRSSRVEKTSRYSSDEEKGRNKDKSWMATGLAGYGLGKMGESLFKQTKDFDDTYSVQTGRYSPNGRKHRSRNDSELGFVRRKESNDQIEVGVIKDRRDYRDARHGSIHGSIQNGTSSTHHRSRSQSRDRKSSATTIGLGALASGAVGASFAESQRPSSKTSHKPHSHSPPRRRRSHKGKKKERGFFGFLSPSSSSSSEDLARIKSKKASKTKDKDDKKAEAALLGLGAAAVALAAADSRSGIKRKGVKDLVGVKETKGSYRPPTAEEAEWEDESDIGSVESALAFGADSRRSSVSTSSSNTSGSRAGDRRRRSEMSGKGTIPRRRSSPGSSIQTGIAGPYSGINGQYPQSGSYVVGGQQSGSPPLQQVFPIATSDPGRFDVAREGFGSSTHPVVASRHDDVPLQQPKPITPVSKSFYSSRTPPAKTFASPHDQTEVDETRRDFKLQRRATSPARIGNESMVTEIAPRRKSSAKDDSSVVRFDIPESEERERRERRRKRKESEEQDSLSRGERRSQQKDDRLRKDDEQSPEAVSKLPSLEQNRRSDSPLDSGTKSWAVPAALGLAGAAVGAAALVENERKESKEERRERRRKERKRDDEADDARRERRRRERERDREEYNGGADLKQDSADETNQKERQRKDRERDQEGTGTQAEKPSSVEIERSVVKAKGKEQSVWQQAASSNKNPVHEDYGSFFFVPPELLNKNKDQVKVTSANADADVEFDNVPAIVTVAPKRSRDLTASPEFSKADRDDQMDPSEVNLPWSVPKLLLISPTPPESKMSTPRIQPSSPHNEDVEPIREISTTNEGQVKTPEETGELSRSAKSDDPVSQSAEGSADIDFAATLAAGVQDAGFDPSIVVDNPSYHRRDSPPGSKSLSDSTDDDSGEKRRRRSKKNRKRNANTSGSLDDEEKKHNVDSAEEKAFDGLDYEKPDGDDQIVEATKPTKSKRSKREKKRAMSGIDTPDDQDEFQDAREQSMITSETPAAENPATQEKPAILEKSDDNIDDKRDLKDSVSWSDVPRSVAPTSSQGSKRQEPKPKSKGASLWDRVLSRSSTNVPQSSGGQESKIEKPVTNLDQHKGMDDEANASQDSDPETSSLIERYPAGSVTKYLAEESDPELSPRSVSQSFLGMRPDPPPPPDIPERQIEARDAVYDPPPEKTSPPISPRGPSSFQVGDSPQTPRSVTSPTAVPVLFRRPGQPRGSFSRSHSQTALSSIDRNEEAPTRPRPRPRSTEFKSSTEIRPLWLVERHRSQQEVPREEEYPSLPSSHTTSRSSSPPQPGLPEDLEMGQFDMTGALGNISDDAGDTPTHDDEKGLGKDLLDSENVAPIAEFFQHATAPQGSGVSVGTTVRPAESAEIASPKPTSPSLRGIALGAAIGGSAALALHTASKDKSARSQSPPAQDAQSSAGIIPESSTLQSAAQPIQEQGIQITPDLPVALPRELQQLEDNDQNPQDRELALRDNRQVSSSEIQGISSEPAQETEKADESIEGNVPSEFSTKNRKSKKGKKRRSEVQVPTQDIEWEEEVPDSSNSPALQEDDKPQVVTGTLTRDMTSDEVINAMVSSAQEPPYEPLQNSATVSDLSRNLADGPAERRKSKSTKEKGKKNQSVTADDDPVQSPLPVKGTDPINDTRAADEHLETESQAIPSTLEKHYDSPPPPTPLPDEEDLDLMENLPDSSNVEEPAKIETMVREDAKDDEASRSMNKDIESTRDQAEQTASTSLSKPVEISDPADKAGIRDLSTPQQTLPAEEGVAPAITKPLVLTGEEGKPSQGETHEPNVAYDKEIEPQVSLASAPEGSKPDVDTAHQPHVETLHQDVQIAHDEDSGSAAAVIRPLVLTNEESKPVVAEPGRADVASGERSELQTPPISVPGNDKSVTGISHEDDTALDREIEKPTESIQPLPLTSDSSQPAITESHEPNILSDDEPGAAELVTQPLVLTSEDSKPVSTESHEPSTVSDKGPEAATSVTEPLVLTSEDSKPATAESHESNIVSDDGPEAATSMTQPLALTSEDRKPASTESHEPNTVSDDRPEAATTVIQPLVLTSEDSKPAITKSPEPDFASGNEKPLNPEPQNERTISERPYEDDVKSIEEAVLHQASTPSHIEDRKETSQEEQRQRDDDIAQSSFSADPEKESKELGKEDTDRTVQNIIEGAAVTVAAGALIDAFHKPKDKDEQQGQVEIKELQRGDEAAADDDQLSKPSNAADQDLEGDHRSPGRGEPSELREDDENNSLSRTQQEDPSQSMQPNEEGEEDNMDWLPQKKKKKGKKAAVAAAAAAAAARREEELPTSQEVAEAPLGFDPLPTPTSTPTPTAAVETNEPSEAQEDVVGAASPGEFVIKSKKDKKNKKKKGSSRSESLVMDNDDQPLPGPDEAPLGEEGEVEATPLPSEDQSVLEAGAAPRLQPEDDQIVPSTPAAETNEPEDQEDFGASPGEFVIKSKKDKKNKKEKSSSRSEALGMDDEDLPLPAADEAPLEGEVEAAPFVADSQPVLEAPAEPPLQPENDQVVPVADVSQQDAGETPEDDEFFFAPKSKKDKKNKKRKGSSRSEALLLGNDEQPLPVSDEAPLGKEVDTAILPSEKQTGFEVGAEPPLQPEDDQAVLVTDIDQQDAGEAPEEEDFFSAPKSKKDKKNKKKKGSSRSEALVIDNEDQPSLIPDAAPLEEEEVKTAPLLSEDQSVLEAKVEAKAEPSFQPEDDQIVPVADVSQQDAAEAPEEEEYFPALKSKKDKKKAKKSKAVSFDDEPQSKTEDLDVTRKEEQHDSSTPLPITEDVGVREIDATEDAKLAIEAPADPIEASTDPIEASADPIEASADPVEGPVDPIEEAEFIPPKTKKDKKKAKKAKAVSFDDEPESKPEGLDATLKEELDSSTPLPIADDGGVREIGATEDAEPTTGDPVDPVQEADFMPPKTKKDKKKAKKAKFISFDDEQQPETEKDIADPASEIIPAASESVPAAPESVPESAAETERPEVTGTSQDTEEAQGSQALSKEINLEDDPLPVKSKKDKKKAKKAKAFAFYDEQQPGTGNDTAEPAPDSMPESTAQAERLEATEASPNPEEVQASQSGSKEVNLEDDIVPFTSKKDKKKGKKSKAFSFDDEQQPEVGSDAADLAPALESVPDSAAQAERPEATEASQALSKDLNLEDDLVPVKSKKDKKKGRKSKAFSFDDEPQPEGGDDIDPQTRSSFEAAVQSPEDTSIRTEDAIEPSQITSEEPAAEIPSEEVGDHAELVPVKSKKDKKKAKRSKTLMLDDVLQPETVDETADPEQDKVLQAEPPALESADALSKQAESPDTSEQLEKEQVTEEPDFELPSAKSKKEKKKAKKMKKLLFEDGPEPEEADDNAGIEVGEALKTETGPHQSADIESEGASKATGAIDDESSAKEPVHEEPSHKEPFSEEPAREGVTLEGSIDEKQIAEKPDADEPVIERPLHEKTIPGDTVAETVPAGESVTEKPVIKEPVAAKTDLEKPAADEPIEKSVIKEPVAAKTDIETPVADGPAEKTILEEPVLAKAVVREPILDESVANKSIADESSAEKTIADEPNVDQPVADEPIVEKAVFEEPTIEKTIVEEPVADKPTTEKTTFDELVADESIAEKIVVGELAADEAVAEKNIVEGPAVDKPVADVRVADEPVADDVAERPIAIDPVLDEPIAKKPIVDEPLVDEVAHEAVINKPFSDKAAAGPDPKESFFEGPAEKEPTADELVTAEPVTAEPVETTPEQDVDNEAELVPVKRKKDKKKSKKSKFIALDDEGPAKAKEIIEAEDEVSPDPPVNAPLSDVAESEVPVEKGLDLAPEDVEAKQDFDGVPVQSKKEQKKAKKSKGRLQEEQSVLENDKDLVAEQEATFTFASNALVTDDPEAGMTVETLDPINEEGEPSQDFSSVPPRSKKDKKKAKKSKAYFEEAPEPQGNDVAVVEELSKASIEPTEPEEPEAKETTDSVLPGTGERAVSEANDIEEFAAFGSKKDKKKSKKSKVSSFDEAGVSMAEDTNAGDETLKSPAEPTEIPDLETTELISLIPKDQAEYKAGQDEESVPAMSKKDKKKAKKSKKLAWDDEFPTEAGSDALPRDIPENKPSEGEELKDSIPAAVEEEPLVEASNNVDTLSADSKKEKRKGKKGKKVALGDEAWPTPDDSGQEYQPESSIDPDSKRPIKNITDSDNPTDTIDVQKTEAAPVIAEEATDLFKSKKDKKKSKKNKALIWDEGTLEDRDSGPSKNEQMVERQPGSSNDPDIMLPKKTIADSNNPTDTVDVQETETTPVVPEEATGSLKSKKDKKKSKKNKALKWDEEALDEPDNGPLKDEQTAESAAYQDPLVLGNPSEAATEDTPMREVNDIPSMGIEKEPIHERDDKSLFDSVITPAVDDESHSPRTEASIVPQDEPTREPPSGRPSQDAADGPENEKMGNSVRDALSKGPEGLQLAPEDLEPQAEPIVDETESTREAPLETEEKLSPKTQSAPDVFVQEQQKLDVERSPGAAHSPSDKTGHIEAEDKKAEAASIEMAGSGADKDMQSQAIQEDRHEDASQRIENSQNDERQQPEAIPLDPEIAEAAPSYKSGKARKEKKKAKKRAQTLNWEEPTLEETPDEVETPSDKISRAEAEKSAGRSPKIMTPVISPIQGPQDIPMNLTFDDIIEPTEVTMPSETTAPVRHDTSQGQSPASGTPQGDIFHNLASEEPEASFTSTKKSKGKKDKEKKSKTLAVTPADSDHEGEGPPIQELDAPDHGDDEEDILIVEGHYARWPGDTHDEDHPGTPPQSDEAGRNVQINLESPEVIERPLSEALPTKGLSPERLESIGDDEDVRELPPLDTPASGDSADMLDAEAQRRYEEMYRLELEKQLSPPEGARDANAPVTTPGPAPEDMESPYNPVDEQRHQGKQDLHVDKATPPPSTVGQPTVEPMLVSEPAQEPSNDPDSAMYTLRPTKKGKKGKKSKKKDTVIWEDDTATPGLSEDTDAVDTRDPSPGQPAEPILHVGQDSAQEGPAPVDDLVSRDRSPRPSEKFEGTFPNGDAGEIRKDMVREEEATYQRSRSPSTHQEREIISGEAATGVDREEIRKVYETGSPTRPSSPPENDTRSLSRGRKLSLGGAAAATAMGAGIVAAQDVVGRGSKKGKKKKDKKGKAADRIPNSDEDRSPARPDFPDEEQQPQVIEPSKDAEKVALVPEQVEDSSLERAESGGPAQESRAKMTGQSETAPSDRSAIRDSAIHVADSPIIPDTTRIHRTERDSGYPETEASLGVDKDDNAETEIIDSYDGNDLGDDDQLDRDQDDPNQVEGDIIQPYSDVAERAASPILHEKSASDNIAEEDHPPLDADRGGRQTPETQSMRGGRRRRKSDAVYDSDDSNDSGYDRQRRRRREALLVQEERRPSPVDSTSKDRSSALFDSSPSARHIIEETQSVRGPPAAYERRVDAAESPNEPMLPKRVPHDEQPDFERQTVGEAAHPSIFGGPINEVPSTPGSPTSVDSHGRQRLKTITEHSFEDSPLSRKGKRDFSDTRSADQGYQARRLSKTEADSPVLPGLVAAGTAAGAVGGIEFLRRQRSKEEESNHSADGDRSRSRDRDTSRRLSNQSNLSAIHRDAELHRQTLGTPDSIPAIIRTPDHVRSASGQSFRSSGTPPLRRVDRSLSSDLRAAAKKSSEASLKGRASTEEAEVDPPRLPNLHIASSSTYDPLTDKGKSRGDMADVYEGWGDVPGQSPMSPTRPPSMRKRQSMQFADLEQRFEQLAAEHRSLQNAKAATDKRLEEQARDHSQQRKTYQDAVQEHKAYLAEKEHELTRLHQILEGFKHQVAELTVVNEELQSSRGIDDGDNEERYRELEAEHGSIRQELEALRVRHTRLESEHSTAIAHEIVAMREEKDEEIRQLQSELEAAKNQIRRLQRQILASKSNDDYVERDEDYFENECKTLCQHVKQWVMRFSKFSDNRACRLIGDLNDDTLSDMFDDAVLDGTEADDYLQDRIKRRDVFMSVVMARIFEHIFARYLFGLDREHRKKLKELDQTLSDIGPVSAVQKWRSTTLSLLIKRSDYNRQREDDTEGVVESIFRTLAVILPPKRDLIPQIKESLRRVVSAAVDLHIEMRLQRAEFQMLPPLKPSFDPVTGDITRKVPFNATTMNERSSSNNAGGEDGAGGSGVSNEVLQDRGAVVRMVLFPLVVKIGSGGSGGPDDEVEEEEGEQIVVCPAQVISNLPQARGSGKQVRVLSAAGQRSEVSFAGTEEGGMF